MAPSPLIVLACSSCSVDMVMLCMVFRSSRAASWLAVNSSIYIQNTQLSFHIHATLNLSPMILSLMIQPVPGAGCETPPPLTGALLWDGLCPKRAVISSSPLRLRAQTPAAPVTLSAPSQNTPPALSSPSEDAPSELRWRLGNMKNRAYGYKYHKIGTSCKNVATVKEAMK